MDILYNVVLFIFVIVCILLVGIILLQTSQSGGLGAVGGGNSYLEGALGSQGADSLLLKTTTIFAVIFLSLEIILYVLSAPEATNGKKENEDENASMNQIQLRNNLNRYA